MACKHSWSVGDPKGWSCDVCNGRVDLPLYEILFWPEKDNPMFLTDKTLVDVNLVLSKAFDDYQMLFTSDAKVNVILAEKAAKYPELFKSWPV